MPVKSSRSRTRQARSVLRPPLGGRLHEVATTRPVPAPPQTSWHGAHLAAQGPILSPQMFVFGQPGQGTRLGHGKTALARMLDVDASRRRGWPVALDRAAAAAYKSVDTLVAVGVIDPLAWAPRPSTSSVRTAGEW